MATTMFKERLNETGDSIDPEEYITALFYVHDDYKHYQECLKYIEQNKSKTKYKK